MELSHIGDQGRAKMVTVAEKEITVRTARARAVVSMKKETLDMIKAGKARKGDVLAVAQVAGITGAKKTSELIPMCHNIFIEGADISFNYLDETNLEIISEIVTTGKTGVEMEALCGVTAAALTVYDMVKAVDRAIIITDVCLLEKSGGKSGVFLRGEIK